MNIHRPRGGFSIIGWPDSVQVFVGGCIKRGVGSSFRATAHAHNAKDSRYFGTICVRGWRKLWTAQGTPSAVMKHELAHILVPGQGHTDAWRAKLRELGGQVRGHYKKRTK